MRRLVCTALLSLLVFPRAFAQTQETINVHVVEVPVTVVGSDGNPVRGLTAKNFEIYDGKEKRAIAGFDTVDFASKESVSAISPMNPVARRNFLILFDLTFSSPKGLGRAQEAARDFLTKELQPRDVAAVATLDAEKGFNLLTTFTTDRSLLLAAIATPRNFLSDDPLRLAARSMTAEDVTRAGAGGQGLMKGRAERAGVDPADMPNAAAEFADLAAHAARQDDQYMRGRIERQMNVLGKLAETLRAVTGRKQIVLLSEGFDPRLVIGRDAQDTNAAAQENVAISRGDIANVDTESRWGSHTSLTLLDAMAKFFGGSDVVLHAIDIQGVRVQNDVRTGAVINSSNGLDLLSRPTGGQVFKGISRDKSNAYPFELGGDTFVPTTRATTDSRKFTVLVWNAKPDELSWQTTPPAKFLGHLQSGSATKLVFQLDKFDPAVGMLDVTVLKKGTTDALKTSVAIQR